MSVKRKVIKKEMQINHKILEDSDDVIQNDEFVGEMPNSNYEYKINKDINNNINHSNVKFFTRGENAVIYNNNSYYLSDNKNNLERRIRHKRNRRNKKTRYGSVIEERRNYKLYLSGIESCDDVISEDEYENKKYKRISNINRINLFNTNVNTNGISPTLRMNDYCNDYNTNTKYLSSNRNLSKNYSTKSFRTTQNYIFYNSPIKKTYKSPYNLKDKGILKDNFCGQYYRVYQAIPLDNSEIEINDNIIDYENNDNKFDGYKIYSAKPLCYKNNVNCYSYNNSAYVSKNKNNILVYSNDIKRTDNNKNNKNFLFIKPKIIKNNNNNIYYSKTKNVYTESNKSLIIGKTETNEKENKPIYLKKKINSKNNINTNKNSTKKIKNNNNNNFVEINESNRDINNNNYLVIKESIRNNKKS